MDTATREFVRRRAGERCEYCLLRQVNSELKHHIEHITAKKHGGSSDSENLALACHRCNFRKGTNLTGIDPLTGAIVRLFHPRRDSWSDHFRFDQEMVTGLSSIGRATVHVLDLNDPRRLELRAEILKKGDPLPE